MYLKAIGKGFHTKPSPTLGSLPAGLNQIFAPSRTQTIMKRVYSTRAVVVARSRSFTTELRSRNGNCVWIFDFHQAVSYFSTPGQGDPPESGSTRRYTSSTLGVGHRRVTWPTGRSLAGACRLVQATRPQSGYSPFRFRNFAREYVTAIYSLCMRGNKSKKKSAAAGPWSAH